MRIWLLVIGLGLGVLAQATVVAAQDPFAPAIVVNERAVTYFEIDQRVALLRAFGAGGDLRALAVEQLTDDRLRLYAADIIGLKLLPDALDQSFDEFATRRELTPEQLTQALGQQGITVNAMLDFIEASMTWREVVLARFRARATPSESDLDAALGFAATPDQISVLLQEIAIPFSGAEEAEVEALATRLSRELNRGGNFGAAVARYSKAASAGNGGRMNWAPASSLPPQLAGQVLALMPGEVSAPVPIQGGFSIVKLLDLRREPRSAATSTTLSVVYAQLIIPLASNAQEAAVAAAQTQAENLRKEIRFCTDIDTRAPEFEQGSGRSNPTPVASVPSNLAASLAVMEPNDIEIIRDQRGVTLLMLCSRSDSTSPEERQALRSRLFNERINSFGQGYLQELRGDAVIEVR